MWLLLPALVLLAATAAAEEPPREQGTLPPLPCVRLLREARVDDMQGASETALAKLRQAVAECPEQLTPRVELLRFARAHALPAEETTKLRAEVAGWLADAGRPLPPGTLGYLVDNPDLQEADHRLILDAVNTRRKGSNSRELIEAAAVLSLRLKRYEEARDLFGQLLAIRPDRSIRWMCVRLDRRLERWDRVVQSLEVLLEEDPDPWVAMSYMEALGKTGRYEELVEHLDALVTQLPPAQVKAVRSPLQALMRQAAWDLRDRGKLEESERIFRRLLAEDPRDAESRAAILYLYSSEEEQRAQQAALAERWSQEEDPHALLDRGSNLLASGDAAGALAPLRGATEALPDSEIAWFNLGLAAFQAEDWSLAERALERAGELNPTRAVAFLNRGAALQKLERCDEALVALAAALKLQPDLYQAHYYLYVCHAALGNHEKGQEALRRYNAARAGS